MEYTHTCRITGMQVTSDTLEVTCIFWEFETFSMDNRSFTATQSGSIAPKVQADKFIPYKELTQDIVISWLDLDFEVLKKQGEANIIAMINPPIINLPPPWI